MSGARHSKKVADEESQCPLPWSPSVEWWHEAADEGNAAAQRNLGFLYYRGQGVPQDHAEAAK